jgi:hypothetical protein
MDRWPRFDITPEILHKAKTERWEPSIPFADHADIKDPNRAILIGRIAEELFKEICEGSRFMDVADKLGDLVFRGLKIDVKGREVSFFSHGLAALIPNKDMHKKPDGYFFIMIKENLKVAWAAGGISHDRYVKEAKIVCKNEGKIKIDCHSLNIKRLQSYETFMDTTAAAAFAPPADSSPSQYRSSNS